MVYSPFKLYGQYSTKVYLLCEVMGKEWLWNSIVAIFPITNILYAHGCSVLDLIWCATSRVSLWNFKSQSRRFQHLSSFSFHGASVMEYSGLSSHLGFCGLLSEPGLQGRGGMGQVYLRFLSHTKVVAVTKNLL